MKDPPKTINVRQFPNPAEFGKIQKKQGQNGAISQHPERVTVQKKLIPAISPPELSRTWMCHLHSLEQFDK